MNNEISEMLFGKHPGYPLSVQDPRVLAALEKITATLAHIEFFLVEIAANTKPK